MSPDEIDKLEGPALDEAVAREFMGWKFYDAAAHEGGTRQYPYCRRLSRDRPGFVLYNGEQDREWSPSRDIRAAWEVVDSIRGRRLSFFLGDPSGYYQTWQVRVTRRFPDEFRDGFGETALLAICRAALHSLSLTPPKQGRRREE